jgi:hypothetical protein
MAAAGCRSDDTTLNDAMTNTHPDASTLDANSNQDASGGQDSGGGGNDATSGGNDASMTNFQVTTVHEAASNFTVAKDVEIDNAVIIADNHYVSTSGGTVGTFFILDMNGTGPGLAVYHGSKDTTPYPMGGPGAVVTVKGHLASFDGELQISSNTRANVTLDISESQNHGTVQGGAVPPAGNPTTITASTSEYAHTQTNPHPEQVGTVIKFTGTQITQANAFVSTDKDGGTTPRGFAVNYQLWVDDSLVYHDCIKTLDGGVNALSLPNGIRGVWERYIDYYGNRNLTLPVLLPTSCADLTNP